MTPLELAVWAAAYVNGGPTIERQSYPVEHADQTVVKLRERLEAKRQQELLDAAKAAHRLQIVTSKRSGVRVPGTMRCSCGYEPGALAADPSDAEERMALHMAHVRAVAPTEH
jgi:hypothetical protein